MAGSGTASNDGFLVGPFNSNSSDLALWNFEAGNITLGTSSQSRLTIDASGNVGIGTSTPTSNLEVFRPTNTGGAIRIRSDRLAGTGAAALLIENASGVLGYIGPNATNSDDMILNANNLNNLRLQTNAQERMRIDYNGSVGIGTSSPSGLVDIKGSGQGGPGNGASFNILRLGNV